MKKILVLLLCMIMVLVMLSACTEPAEQSSEESPATQKSEEVATPDTSTEESAEVSAEESTAEVGLTPRTVVDRPDATPGDPITPTDSLLAQSLTGLDKIGAVPTKQYFIAFSNGDMVNNWRRTFVDDMVAYAEKYQERFGITFKWTNANGNTTQQLADIQSLIAQKPDLLIVSPNEADALNVIDKWATEAGVPYFCIDRGIGLEPGTGNYKALIQGDNYLNGIANAIGIVNKLTEKYGEPKGNVVELPGTLGASVAIQRSQGLHYVLSQFPNIKIVAVRPTDFDRTKAFAAAQDILTTYPEGEIDVFVGGSDDIALGSLEAVKAAGRTELLGYIFGIDGTTEFLNAILAGEVAETNEYSPYYGMVTMEYAIQYLNGVDIENVVMLPQQRNYSAETEEKRTLLEEFVKTAEEQGLGFIPVDMGGHEVFNVDSTEVAKYYDIAKIQEVTPFEETK